MARKRVSDKEIVISTPIPARHKPANTNRVARTAPAAEQATASPATPEAPSREEIAKLAYTYWAGRGYQGGSPEEDWVRAERELAGRHPLTSTANA